MTQKKIIHIDMDAFYASVEQRDFPEYRGKPVVVGGSPESRGVVSTASYEARKFGIHSAMPTATAYRLCPKAIFVFPRFEAYKEVSEQIREIFHEYTDLVEPLSLDEAYLDVTENKLNENIATLLAKKIREQIQAKTKLTASAGVAPSKFLAKIASGMNKPDGLTVITPREAEEFLEKLPIGKFHGIGKVTEKKFLALGIKNGKDLKSWNEKDLVEHFGKSGAFYHKIVRGEDDREVVPNHIRKSIGAENTFAEDILEMERLLPELAHIIDILWKRMEKAGTRGKTMTLKVKYSNFEVITRSITAPLSIQNQEQLRNLAMQLLNQTEAGKRKIRLLGLSFTGLKTSGQDIKGEQLELGF